jgi:uncharacterized protein YqjF (DUF2071 family)
MTDWQAILEATGHRPYPLPTGRRLTMTMSWHDLLFAHWRVDVARLRRLIPSSLELDLWNGEAWLGVVPFYMSQVGLPSLNHVPWMSAFEELNVRTYVKHGSKPGVFFFSLDAANWLAVLGARAGFRLPYFWAHMSRRNEGTEGAVHYSSQRLIGPHASFEARYGPTGAVYRAPAGSLDHWLTERYCLYTADRRGRAYRSDIHHEPWPLQAAEARLTRQEMTEWLGFELTGQPSLLHFARRLDVLAWPLEPAARNP